MIYIDLKSAKHIRLMSKRLINDVLGVTPKERSKRIDPGEVGGMLDVLVAYVRFGNYIDVSADFMDYLEDVKSRRWMKILARSTDPSACDNFAIIWSSLSGRSSFVQKLLDDDRVDPTAHDNLAIRSAIVVGNETALKLLLDDGRSDPSKYTYEISSTMYNTDPSGVVNLLLEDGRVDFTAENYRVLKKAMEYGKVDTYRMIFRSIRLDRDKLSHLFLHAVSQCGANVVKFLLSEFGIDPSTHDNLPLIEATRHGNMDTMRILMDDVRVDPSANENKALLVATGNGNAGAMRILMVDVRVDPSAHENRALHTAITSRRREAIRILLKDKSVINRGTHIIDALKLGYTTVEECVRIGWYGVVYGSDEDGDSFVVRGLVSDFSVYGMVCLNDIRNTNLVQEVMSYIM